MKNLGLALSGGGARGMVHAGVIQAFEENGIVPDVLSGTSAGSIVGSLYASGYSSGDIRELAKKQSWYKLASLNLPNKGFIRHKHLRKLLMSKLGSNTFEGLNLPFYIAVANLNTGEAEVWSSGPLVDLVIASSSVPIMFEPVTIEDSIYVDGGLLMNLPAMPIRPLCRILVGVNLVPIVNIEREKLSSVMSVGSRCFDLSALNNIKPHLSVCDVVIEPTPIHEFSRYSFSDMETMYELGYEEALKHIPEIKRLLSELDD